jgi:GT2 family glycosyltransferase
MKLQNINATLDEIIKCYQSEDHEKVLQIVLNLYNNNIFQERIYEIFAHSLYIKNEFDTCLQVIQLLEEKVGISDALKVLCFECHFALGHFKECLRLYENNDNLKIPNINRKIIFCYNKASKSRKAYEEYIKSGDLGKYHSKISIVIPVLDLSPGTPDHNIIKLLEDLQGLDAEIIVVFNNSELGYSLKNHPRINQYAILSSNVGVSRAWNIGLDISRSEYTFILNSDLRIDKGIFNALVNEMEIDRSVAMAGPQGCLVDLNENGLETQQLIKRGFSEKKYVDLIMGFMFVVRTELFHAGTLKFDNRLTPAFCEEIDIARQIKLSGLKMLAVPYVGFSHGGSGSHLLSNEIKFYDQSSVKMDIINRNDCFLFKKWFVDKDNIHFEIESI